jgi:hypothetical protein
MSNEVRRGATESITPRIRQIATCVKGNYVNVYGLDEHSRVWTWDPTKARWAPYKITARARRPEPPRRSEPRRDGWE